jgi:cysteinyl-tRNA synthetase
MSLFKEFTILFPYLQSVRKLKTYLSFDIEFPESWKLPKKYVNEEKIVENEKSKQGYRFFSFVSEFDEKLVDEIISNIKNIIGYNKEREEKDRLFQNKVNELKVIFEKQNLHNLQALKFEITEDKIELEDDEETTEPTGREPGMVEK